MQCSGGYGLLAEAHGACLRLLADSLPMEVDGLAVAARKGRQAGVIDAKLCKRLERLDTTFAGCLKTLPLCVTTS